TAPRSPTPASSRSSRTSRSLPRTSPTAAASCARRRRSLDPPGDLRMHALVLHEHGGLDKLVFEAKYPDPSPGAGDVILSMRACSLNYHDVFTRKGMPGIKVPLPLITGIDVAGEVVGVGPGVTGFSPGDQVLVDPIDRVDGGLLGETMNGGLAELVRVPAH